MACQAAAARSLAAAIPPAEGSGASLLADLSALQGAVTLASIRAKLAETPRDYGFRSVSDIMDDDDTAVLLSSENTVRVGRAYGAFYEAMRSGLDRTIAARAAS